MKQFQEYARSFLNSAIDSPGLEIKQGDIRMEVDKSLEQIRPVILGAVVRGVDNGTNSAEKDDFIQSLMDHQEKLHLTLGRKESLHLLVYMIYLNSNPHSK